MLLPIDHDLPILKLTLREFEELPEYSATYPTGVIIGKRWKRLDGLYDAEFKRAGGRPRWVIGEYVEVAGDKTKARYKWWKPVIIIRCRTA